MAEDHTDDASMNFDFVLVAGHFLMRDENIFTYFEGQGVKIDHHSESQLLYSVSFHALCTAASQNRLLKLACQPLTCSPRIMLGRSSLLRERSCWHDGQRGSLLSCAAARSAVQAAQGLAALQEVVPSHGSEDQTGTSGRHLAHPSTRHRHSGSGSAAWQQRSAELPNTPFGRSGSGALKAYPPIPFLQAVAIPLCSQQSHLVQ